MSQFDVTVGPAALEDALAKKASTQFTALAELQRRGLIRHLGLRRAQGLD